MAKEKPSIEDALMLVHAYAGKDDKVVALAKAYVQSETVRETMYPHWKKLDQSIAAIKRAFRPEEEE